MFTELSTEWLVILILGGSFAVMVITFLILERLDLL